MASYLLTCDCGQTWPVELSQAGGQIDCSCGQKLEVPTLRKLRHLPLAPSDASQTAPAWDARKGAITIFLLLAGALAAVSLWNRLTEPKLPIFDPAAQGRFVDQGLDNLTPVEAWQAWIAGYRPMAEKGFGILESHDTPVIRDQIARQRFFQAVMLCIAGICAALAVTVALWPTAAKTRRGGDKETRRSG